MADYEDMTLTCRDCQNQFVAPAGELRWLATHFGADFKVPSRCKACRDKRKAEKQG